MITRLASQAALGRSRGNARAVLEDGLARRIGIRQDLGVDVDDHLVALARGAGIHPVMQCRLREQGEGIRLLLDHRRRVGFRLLIARLLIQRLARGRQRLHEQGTDLRGQPPPDDHRAVAVRIHLQGAAGMLPGRLSGLGLPVHLPPAAHDALDVLGGAGPAHRQQPLLRLGGRDAGQGADLGVGEFTAGEGLGQQRQRAERARHPHVLAGRGRGEPHAPGQPGGAGAEAGVPAGAGVELADEIEQARGGGVEVGGELGDLIAQAVEVGRGHLHDESSFC